VVISHALLENNLWARRNAPTALFPNQYGHTRFILPSKNGNIERALILAKNREHEKHWQKEYFLIERSSFPQCVYLSLVGFCPTSCSDFFKIRTGGVLVTMQHAGDIDLRCCLHG